MDCSRVDKLTVVFHRGDLEGAERAAIEQHLQTCASCLAGYFELKRAADASERSQALPSPLVRSAVLRQAHAALRLKPVQAVGGAFLLLATAAAMLFWVLQSHPPHTGDPRLAPGQLLDTEVRPSHDITTL